MNITCSKDHQLDIRTGQTKIVIDDQILINGFSLKGPGEYEVAQVMVSGIAEPKSNSTIYLFDIEGMAIAYFSGVVAELSDQLLERLEGIDILILPANHNEDSDVKKLVEVINRVDPKIAVAINPAVSTAFGQIEGIKPEVTNSLKLTKKLLPEEERKIFVMQCKIKEK